MQKIRILLSKQHKTHKDGAAGVGNVASWPCYK